MGESVRTACVVKATSIRVMSACGRTRSAGWCRLPESFMPQLILGRHNTCRQRAAKERLTMSKEPDRRSVARHCSSFIYEMIGPLLCMVCGHKWPILHVTDRARGVGSCCRCGIVAVTEREVGTCFCCGADMVHDDDDARVCTDCGGMNRRAVIQ